MVRTAPATFAALLGAAAAARTPPGHAGVGALRGCIRTSEALLPPSSPLTLLLEESQKRGEVPAHENHHGGQEKGLLPAGGGLRRPQPRLCCRLSRRGADAETAALSPHARPCRRTRLQDARREDARPAEQLREERPEPRGGGESGGRRGRPGCSQRAPGAGRRRARPLLWPPARPQPSLPSCTKRAGTHRAWHRAECRECPLNCCAQGESCRIIHINHTWSPLGPATLQTGVLAFTPVCPTGRSWEALCLQASTLGICCSVADHPHIPTMSPSTAASRSLEPVALGDNRASDQSNQ